MISCDSGIPERLKLEWNFSECLDKHFLISSQLLLAVYSVPV